MKLRNECPSYLFAGSPEHLEAMVEWCRWRCHRTCGLISKWKTRAKKWDAGLSVELWVWLRPDEVESKYYKKYADTLRGEVDFYREALQEERFDLRKWLSYREEAWKSYRESGDESSLYPTPCA